MPGKVQWKLFWSVLGAALALAGAAIPTMLGVPWWITALGSALVVAPAAMLIVRLVVRNSELFEDVPLAHSGFIVWINAAVGLNALWMILFAARPDLAVVWVPGLVGLVGLEYGFARAQEYLLLKLKGRKAAAKEPGTELALAPTRTLVRQRQPDGTMRELGAVESEFAVGLRRAQLEWLLVTGHDPVAEQGKEPFGYRFKVRQPSRQTLVEAGKAKTAATRTLDPSATEEIAIAMAEVYEPRMGGRDFLSDFIQIEDHPAAGTWYILLVWEDLLARVFPYVDDTTQASIRKAVRVGIGKDGQPYEMIVRAHAQIIGKSTSGKSSLLNVLIAWITRCIDVVPWACGVQKLYDLVGPWVDPYMDLDEDLPFDWIASGPKDVLEMLAAAMRIARWRQSVPTHLRKRWPILIVILDEASFALQRRETIEFEGRACSASNLVAQVTKGAASAGVYVWLATQRSTNDNFGEYGGDITANIGWSAVFQSQDEAEIGRVTGDWKAPMPRHKGVCWLRPSEDGLPIQIKAEYIQPNDISKDTLHDGATITDVALARRGMRNRLDADSAAQAGDAYHQRHRRMNDDMRTYLSGFRFGSGAPALPAAVGDGTTPAAPAPTGPAAGPSRFGVEEGPGSAAYQAGADQVRAQLAAAGVPMLSEGAGGNAELPAAPSAPTPPAPAADVDAASTVTQLGDRRTRPERIMAILTDAEEPLERAEILAQLHTAGDSASQQSVSNDLTRLVAKGDIERLPAGGYVIVRVPAGR